MKKLTAILGAICLFTVPTSGVVSCLVPDEEIPWDEHEEILDLLNIKITDIFVNNTTTKEQIQDYFIDQLDQNSIIKDKYEFEAMDYDKQLGMGFFLFSINEDIDGLGEEGDDFNFNFTTKSVDGIEIKGQTQLGDYDFTRDLKVKFGSESDTIEKTLFTGIDKNKYFSGNTEIIYLKSHKFNPYGSCKIKFKNDVDLAYKADDVFDFDFEINWTDPQNAVASQRVLDTSLGDIQIRSDRNSLADIESEISNTLNQDPRINNKWKYYPDKGQNIYYDSKTKTGEFILEFTGNVENYFSTGDYKQMKFTVNEKDMSYLEYPEITFFDCDFSGIKLKPTAREDQAKAEVIKILDQSSKLKNKYELIDNSFKFSKEFNSFESSYLDFRIRATQDVDINFKEGDVKFLHYNFSFEGTTKFKINNETKYNFIMQVFEEEIEDIIFKNSNKTVGDFKRDFKELVKRQREYDVDFGIDEDVHLSTNLKEFDDTTSMLSISKIRLVGVTQKILGDHTFNLR
ncbi:hypothetical protein [Spiroplasma endosymbiont of Panorpa germanica]|uniref:hypothetical protein n=1 Tax=Spiroplasma endosymbiont of Panorpa germanica TaxID=3066314 RepID=UPI0030D1395C